MKRLNSVNILLALAAILAASSATVLNAEADADTDYFQKHCRPLSPYTTTCPDLPEVSSFKCSSLRLPPRSFAALTPKTPLLICIRSEPRRAASEMSGVYVAGCRLAQSVNYIMPVDGKLQLLDSTEAVLKLFTPIETVEEAAALVEVLTNSRSAADMPVKPEGATDDAKISGDNYLVTRFEKELCGCGKHPILKKEYLVSKAGLLELMETTPLQNTSEQDLCVD